ncbi:MAG TPA: D-glycerate dehydrogenase [Gemmatimonadales bacterium]|nr:D-glycerate dehydrogenase [Gemmatimonadales bacterium]
MSGAQPPVVAVTRRLPAPVESALAERFTVRLNRDDLPLDADGLRQALASADAVLCTVSDAISAEVIAVKPLRATLLANFGVGFNHIDLTAARARGLAVTNTPGVLTDDTADLAIALMLMACRRLGEGERELRGGRWTGWRPTHHLATRVTGKTLGIIGMGRIGRAVARRAVHGFGMQLVYASRSPLPPGEAAALDAVRMEVDEVCATADVVTLHVPSDDDTRHLIDARRLALMPRHAVLINTARGEIVDEGALADALERGAIAGAGLDVYTGEPRVSPRLLALENVVLLPHLGSATLEARTAMGMRALENLVAWSEGREPPDRVA